jgi:hypothetical protein
MVNTTLPLLLQNLRLSRKVRAILGNSTKWDFSKFQKLIVFASNFGIRAVGMLSSIVSESTYSSYQGPFTEHSSWTFPFASSYFWGYSTGTVLYNNNVVWLYNNNNTNSVIF